MTADGAAILSDGWMLTEGAFTTHGGELDKSANLHGRSQHLFNSSFPRTRLRAASGGENEQEEGVGVGGKATKSEKQFAF